MPSWELEMLGGAPAGVDRLTHFSGKCRRFGKHLGNFIWLKMNHPQVGNCLDGELTIEAGATAVITEKLAGTELGYFN